MNNDTCSLDKILRKYASKCVKKLGQGEKNAHTHNFVVKFRAHLMTLNHETQANKPTYLRIQMLITHQKRALNYHYSEFMVATLAIPFHSVEISSFDCNPIAPTHLHTHSQTLLAHTFAWLWKAMLNILWKWSAMKIRSENGSFVMPKHTKNQRNTN